MKAQVRQIFYDEATRALLDPGFLPLDNTANRRPEWYELWVIREFLRHHTLDADTWYGFVSPGFGAKTGLGSADVYRLLEGADASADVALFSPGWDQVGYFLNAFEQGDFWHPGLAQGAQAFFDRVGLDLDLQGHVGHSFNTVYCNFVVARPVYWHAWLDLANLLFDEIEDDEDARGDALRAMTAYGFAGGVAPMRAFLQERLACALLAVQKFRTVSADLTALRPPDPALFVEPARARRTLIACEVLKHEYASGGGAELLASYERLRASIATCVPVPPAADFLARRRPSQVQTPG